ncbi:fasciclin domain-containing protein [Aequorivita flava]|uniref:Fasciclin domain-containing protein n=1 Tax=Aequorivita flava TaxID=3114371 RepID=A0AB35YXR6_9FLAO
MQLRKTFVLLFIICFGTTVSAQKYLSTNSKEISKVLGESNFTSSKTFYENLKDAPDFTILAKILKNDQLRKSLEKPEMVTIFAIADEAFTNLPEKSRDSILNNPRIVNSIVTYLAVPGRLDSNSLKVAVEENGGKAYLITIKGKRLGIKEEQGELMLVDDDNNTATIIAPDFYHKNGFFHIVNGLVFPN